MHVCKVLQGVQTEQYTKYSRKESFNIVAYMYQFLFEKKRITCIKQTFYWLNS